MKKPLAIVACALALATTACGNKNATVTTTTTTEPAATSTTTSVVSPSATSTVTKSAATKTSTSTETSTSATTKTTTSSVNTHSATTTASSTATTTTTATATATATKTTTATATKTTKATYSPSGKGTVIGTGNSVVPTTLTIGSLKLSTGAIPKYSQASSVKVTKVSNTMTMIAVQNPTGNTMVFPLVKLQQLSTAATTDAAIKAVCASQLGTSNVVLDKGTTENVCTRADTKAGIEAMHWYQIKGKTYIMLTIEPLGTPTAQDQLFSNVVVALDKNLQAAE